MTIRVTSFFLAAIVLVLSIAVWRSQLFTVQRTGATPVPLVVRDPTDRPPADLDVVLPAVPTGMRRLTVSDHALLVHYWAPWEQNSRAQASALDSLAHLPGLENLTIVIVCFDPFPSVARYVARQRLRVTVLLDTHHELRQSLPCPSIPYTYVVDSHGYIAIEQEGEVDWLAPATLAALQGLVHELPGDPPAARRTVVSWKLGGFLPSSG